MSARKMISVLTHSVTASVLSSFIATTSALAAGTTEYRTIDGSDNNQIDTSMGQADTALLRLTPAAYADGVSAMSGTSRPNARVVSNAMAQMPGKVVSDRYLPSDFLWAWGQFIDHDISISEGAEPVENAAVQIPVGDPWFDPLNSGDVELPFHRTVYDQSTGTSAQNPRQQVNQITAWIDASNVYGSDSIRADALRRNDGSGKLKTSRGRLLPFNTVGLPNAGGTSDQLFLAGDVRANEQLGLTALHTLFVREHNRLASKMARQHPRWSGEKIYQRARRIVGAQLQKITYEEYLPVLLGNGQMPAYGGYVPWVDASVRNEFSTSLYRYGHSAIGNRLMRLNRRGRETRFGHLSLAEAFFSPQRLANEGGIAPLFRGMAKQACQPIDLIVTDELRNFLFGPPGAGGLDLAALNIQRGRDHGIADYNTVRVAYGLSRVNSFAQISSSTDVQTMLQELYGSVDNIDAWVGALSEDTHAGMVGELLHVSFVEQFAALRDGDRYWHTLHLNRADKRELTSLAKIIKRNTPVGSELQRRVFITRVE